MNCKDFWEVWAQLLKLRVTRLTSVKLIKLRTNYHLIFNGVQ